jgi:hypothetical protein
MKLMHAIVRTENFIAEVENHPDLEGEVRNEDITNLCLIRGGISKKK